MNFKDLGDSRSIGIGQVQYVADSSHAHEGGHRVAVADRELLVLPDGRTTARNRSHVITRVLHAVEGTEVNPVESLVGALIMAGATRIMVDDRDVLDFGDTTVASLRLDLTTTPDGQFRFEAVHLGSG